MKYFFALSLILFFSSQVVAQVKIGANALPALSVNRISSESDTISYNNNGPGYKIAFGLLFDIELKKNYNINTGIYWFPKRLGLVMNDQNGEAKASYRIQYIQIPFNFKLMTDEFTIDKWFYFQLGLAFEIKIDESGKRLEDFYIEKLNFLDVVLDPGVGIEMKLGQNTTFFSGITYYRGLINVAKPQSFLKGDLKVKNDYWALNLGIKF